MMTRREAIQHTALLTAACAAGASAISCVHSQSAVSPAGPFTLPALPYPLDALEPYIDAQTMALHHDKHHQAYVTNLNKALASHPELASRSIEDLLRDLNTVPEDIRTAVRNQGGGHYNHSLWWPMLKKERAGKPRKGAFADALKAKFGKLDNFKSQYTDAALKVFGSGWTWLTLDGKELRIESTPNQDTPWSQGRAPLLGIDVWEHAYYLRYQNRRADYIAAFYNVINWDYLASRYEQLVLS